MANNLKKLTSNQLAKKRDRLIKKIVECDEQSRYDNNSHCGLMIDSELVNEYYHDLITDLIEVLLETMKRTDYLDTL